MQVGTRVVMKKHLKRVGLVIGDAGEVFFVDRMGRVNVKFDKAFGGTKSESGGAPIGTGYLFDPKGEYPPEEYLDEE